MATDPVLASAEELETPPTSPRLAASAALAEDVGRLAYVSGAREEALRRMRVNTVRDLFALVPRRYLDFTHALTIEQAPLGEVATIVGSIDRVQAKRTRTRMSVVEVSLVDDTGVMQLAFFKQPWIAQQLAPGDRIAAMGKVEFAYGFKQMASPHFEKLEGDRPAQILPVHPASEGVTPAWMRRIVSSAIESRRLFHSFFSPALTTAILLPSSIEAASEAAFAAFSPFSCMSSATDARASPSTPPIRESRPCESAITSSPCLPVRRITASSSAVDRLSGPRRSSFSRGRCPHPSIPSCSFR